MLQCLRIRRPDLGHIAINPPQGARTDRHDATFPAFSQCDPHHAAFPIHIINGERDQFAPADAGGVEDFHDRSIPQAVAGL